MVKISVIITTHNYGYCIENAIQSVINQTLSREKYEIIITDDNSTDCTHEILEKYKSEINQLISCNHNSLSEARNTAILHSKGEYLIFLDPDDRFHPDLLEKTLPVLDNPEKHFYEYLDQKKKFYWVYTDRYEVYAKPPWDTIVVRVGDSNIFNMIACGTLFRREVFKETGGYRDLLFEEYDLMIRLICRTDLKGHYLHEPLYFYTKHESSMSNQKDYWMKGWNQLLDAWCKKK